MPKDNHKENDEIITNYNYSSSEKSENKTEPRDNNTYIPEEKYPYITYDVVKKPKNKLNINKNLIIVIIEGILLIAMLAGLYLFLPKIVELYNKNQDDRHVTTIKDIFLKSRNHYSQFKTTPWEQDKEYKITAPEWLDKIYDTNQIVSNMYINDTTFFIKNQTITACFTPRSIQYKSNAAYNEFGETLPTNLATHYCLVDNYNEDAIPIFNTEPK